MVYAHVLFCTLTKLAGQYQSLCERCHQFQPLPFCQANLYFYWLPFKRANALESLI